MPAERRYGMDHEHYAWSPVTTRKVLRWPQGARVALCVIVSLEHFEWDPPEGSWEVGNLAGGLTIRPMPFPDYPRYAHRDYGHRVGVFRVLDVLQKRGIRPTVAMDALTAENYPYLVRHCLQQGCEIIAHGVSVSRMITSRMSEQEEREYIRTSVEAIRQATGAAPLGWLGPECGESTRTPQLLAEAGIRYVCDWPNDEQPYPMKTASGEELYSLPVMLDLDDVLDLWERRLPVHRYAELLKEAFDTIYHDAAESGRLLALNLHPWLIGQPFRIGFLDAALEYMTRRQGVWPASGWEIVDWYRRGLLDP